jgi:ABC-2 type transport system ATP-binding protein
VNVTEFAIQTTAVTKRYGTTLALDALDHYDHRGVVFGFLGPNGAGKSTAIRLFVAALHADEGSVRVLGVDPFTAPAAWRSEIGYLPGELVLPRASSAGAYLEYLARLRGGRGQEQIRPLATRLSLDLDKPMRSLSKGNKQKVGVIQAFMHDPQLLILDEPTSGLDPLLQNEVANMIADAKARGATVFFSSHVLSEVEASCQRVAIIRQGRLMTVDSVARLRAMAGQTLRASIDEPARADVFEGLSAVTDVAVVNGELTATVHGDIGAVLSRLNTLRVTRLELVNRELDDLFLAYYHDVAPGTDHE